MNVPEPTPNLSDSPSLAQSVAGDRNQVIGQVLGGIVINQLTINERIPTAIVPPTAVVPPLTQQEYRQRQVLLNKVKDYWIEGVLKTSLHARAMIELGLHARPDLVQRPFQDVAEFPDISVQAIPDDTSAITAFDQMGQGRTLLILGEPGSGKTITLLRLAEDLIARTGNEVSQPVPVVFNLSSWARKPQPIETWLVQELVEKYQVSKALGKTWVETESLLLLLDGLDEVKAEQRNACVRALNQFIQTHGTTELIICCRIKDYQALAEQLRLRSAICVQPLTSDQINQYFEQSGEQLESLKEVLLQDEELQGLATSPLMLSIMSLAYQGSKREDIIKGVTPEDYRQRLFGKYIDRMFKRRGTTQQYSRQKAQHWLIWLAQYMLKTSQTEFFIEQLQPDSLTKSWQKTLYKIVISLTIKPLNFYFPKFIFPGIIIAISLFAYPHQIGLFLIYQYQVFKQGEIYEPLFTFTFVSAGIPISAFLSILSSLFKNPKGLLIKPVESMNWDWSRLKQHFSKVLQESTWIKDFEDDGCKAIFAFLMMAPILIPIQLIYLFLSTVNSTLYISDLKIKTVSNQGIRNSGRNSLLGILIGFLVSEALIFLINIWFNWIISPLRLEIYFPELLLGLSPFSHLILTVLAGLLGWSIYGGSACVQHFILRTLLTLNSSSPWNYAAFLDNSTDRLFLQKVGGGYIFVHRMLLEHFAAMPLEQEKRQDV